MRLLDLFCGGGGASRGYVEAGWDVVGVDIKPQPHYPYDFVQTDALTFPLDGFDAAHSSPPCQLYSITNASRRHSYPDLVGPTRERLRASGLPYVIENVPRAPLLDPMVLCGTMFGLTAVDDDGTLLQLQRHRLFESNMLLVPPGPCQHDRSIPIGGCYAGARRDRYEAKHIRQGGYVPSYRVQQQLMGIDWLPEKVMQQAIPPVYSQWIGAQLLDGVESNQKVS